MPAGSCGAGGVVAVRVTEATPAPVEAVAVTDPQPLAEVSDTPSRVKVKSGDPTGAAQLLPVVRSSSLSVTKPPRGPGVICQVRLTRPSESWTRLPPTIAT